jgi:predicted NBD/HSP70 family sugar kinase
MVRRRGSDVAARADRHALGIHLRRDGARAVLVGKDGTVVRTHAVDGESFAAAVDAAARARETATVSATGVAVDPLDGLTPTVVVDRLSSLGSVRVSGTGAASAIAEAWVGAARGVRHAVTLWIGNTVSAGILLDGRPWSGSHACAGAAAWLALNPVERQDYRRFGSLAAEVSYSGIARRLAWRIQSGDESRVLDVAGDLESITAAHVFDGARSGDGVSISVVREAAKYIGMAIANLIIAVDPDIAVLAGPVAMAGDLLLDPVRQECARRLPPQMAASVRCEISPLGEDGIAIGAARLASPARA